MHLDADLADAEMAALYRACDVLVHPYRGEGFAMPVLEAMASGLPVIHTAGGPTDEFCPPQAGWRIRAQRRAHARRPRRPLRDDRRAVDARARSGAPGRAPSAAADAGADRAARGAIGRSAALHFGWERIAGLYDDLPAALAARAPAHRRDDRVLDGAPVVLATPAWRARTSCPRCCAPGPRPRPAPASTSWPIPPPTARPPSSRRASWPPPRASISTPAPTSRSCASTRSPVATRRCTLREAADAGDRAARGAIGRSAALHFGWERIAGLYGERARALAARAPPHRGERPRLDGAPAVLATPAWRAADELPALLRAWTQAPAGACLYLLADPATDGTPAELEARVMAAAAGIDLDACADITILREHAVPGRDAALHAAADLYVPLHASCAGHLRLAGDGVNGRAGGCRRVARRLGRPARRVTPLHSVRRRCSSSGGQVPTFFVWSFLSPASFGCPPPGADTHVPIVPVDGALPAAHAGGVLLADRDCDDELLAALAAALERVEAVVVWLAATTAQDAITRLGRHGFEHGTINDVGAARGAGNACCPRA